MKKRTLESVLDEYLVVASQNGDREALRRLVQRWNGRFTRLAYTRLKDGEAAKDVVQEAWLRALTSPPRLQTSLISRLDR